MSDSPGPGGDAENMNDFKNTRIRAADTDDGIDIIPPKCKKVEEELQNPAADDVILDDELDDEEVDAEDIDFPEDEEVEEGDYEERLDENTLDETGESSELDEFIQTNLVDIERCQSDIETLNKKANDEILKVEQKYNKLRQPVYARRNTYIDRIPNFWATVFSRHPQLKRVLSKDDVKCLGHLSNLQIDDFEDSRSGYRIKFSFSKNPWFSNPLITKEYHLPWNDSPSCICTSINWHPGMNLTQTQSSFFSWFCSQDDASTDDIAEIIKEELWPNPLQAYMTKENGEVESDDSADDDDEEAVYIDDDEDEEEPEYISSDDGEEEEEWAEYRRQKTFGKEVPGSRRGRQMPEDEENEVADYEGDLIEDDSGSRELAGFPQLEGDPSSAESVGEGDDSGDDGSAIEEKPDSASDVILVNPANHDVTPDTDLVTSKEELQSEEISQTPSNTGPSPQKDVPDDVTTTVESET